MDSLKLCWIGVIKSAAHGFDNNLENLAKTLNKKQFPTKLINKVTKQYLNLKFDKKLFENKTKVKTDTRFFKLAYLDKYSFTAQKKIQNLVKTFCKDINIRVVPTLLKISNKFSCPDINSSSIIYQLQVH